MSKCKARCRTCLFLNEKKENWRIVCGHPIMAAVHGQYPISEKHGCVLWVNKEKQNEKGEKNGKN